MRLRAFTLAAVLAASVEPPALGAQEREAIRPRHLRPVFGQQDSRQTPERDEDGGMTVNGAAYGAYDDDVASEVGPRPPVRGEPRVGGTYTSLNGRLAFNRLSDTLSFTANAASAVRYYPQFERFAAGRQLADASVVWPVSTWRTGAFAMSGSGRLSQYSSPFTGALLNVSDDLDAAESDLDDIVRSQRRASVQGEANLDQRIGRRSTLMLLAGAQTSALEAHSYLSMREFGGGLSVLVSRTGTVRGGYVQQQVDRGPTNYIVHQLLAGGDYRRPLPASRRGELSFAGGTSLIEARGTTRVFLSGNAALRYEMHRPWTWVVRYNRGVNFIDEVPEPLLSDAVLASISGVLSRRLELSGSASASRGVVGLTANASTYDMLGGRGRLQFGLSPTVALYAEYLVFHYRFDEQASLGPEFRSRFDRQTARVGVTFSRRLIR